MARHRTPFIINCVYSKEQNKLSFAHINPASLVFLDRKSFFEGNFAYRNISFLIKLGNFQIVRTS